MAIDGEEKPGGGGETSSIAEKQSDASANPAPAPPPPAFKSRSSRGNIRRRKAAADSDDEDDEGVNVAKKARAQQQGLSMGTAGGKKDISDGNDGDNDVDLNNKATGARFVSDRKRQESGDALATAELQTETEFDRDAR